MSPSTRPPGRIGVGTIDFVVHGRTIGFTDRVHDGVHPRSQVRPLGLLTAISMFRLAGC